MNSTYIDIDEICPEPSHTPSDRELYNFSAMSVQEHLSVGHFNDSTGSWINPGDYISAYYAEW